SPALCLEAPLPREAWSPGEAGGRPSSQGERNALVSVYVAHVDAHAATLVHLEAREAERELLQGNPTLEPCQRRAEAEMDSLAEAESDRDPAPDLEAVRRLEFALVAIRGCREEEDPRTARDRLPVPLDVARQRASLVLRR